MKEHFHFIGIGGIGMSALVRILLEKNATISGSDVQFSPYLAKLAKEGVTIAYGHAAANLPPKATVVYSSIIDTANPELKLAKERGERILHRSELLAELTKGQRVIAVTGTHGKTTVTAMLSYVCMHAGKDPSFAIGGMLDLKDFFESPINGRGGRGDFILEADESDGSFLNYDPFGAIITSIEADHLDYYGSKERMDSAYAAFAQKVFSYDHLFYYGDDPHVAKTIGKRGFSFGFKEGNDLRILNFSQKEWSQTFSFSFKGENYSNVQLRVPGKHNALNAAAVFGCLLQLGLSEGEIRHGLELFPGVHRRCERRGEVNQVLFIDDYAHHPTEVEVTLQAIHEAIYPRRLIVVFQPHRFTRMADLVEEFARSFELSDTLFVTDIYGAGEKPIPGITAELLLAKIRQNSSISASYLSITDAPRVLYEKSLAGDVIVTLGAGDITSLHNTLIPYFQTMPLKKIRVGLIFGGRSSEHEVSLLSAGTVSENRDQTLLEMEYISIDKSGVWNCEKGITVSPSSRLTPHIPAEVMQKIEECDLLLPILHGPMGEDGTIQAFFEMLEKPAASPGYLSCALCMDKVLSKKLAALEDVPILPFFPIHSFEWCRSRLEILEKLQTLLPLPLFVKPIHLGSTVGITKVIKWEELEEAIVKAFTYDSEIMVEKGLEAPRELEYCILGDSQFFYMNPLPGELKTGGAIYDYAGKYGPTAMEADLYPPLSPSQEEEGLLLARKVYLALKCSIMARVDFFLDHEGKFWFNEINPIPGLTANSMYPKVWQREGLSKQELITKLIYLGLKKKRRNYNLNAPIG